MAWEKRSIGSYYYRKVRVGSKVRSIYVGNNILSYKLYGDTEKQKKENLRQKAEIEAEEGIDQALEDNHKMIIALAEGALLVNNYHLHRGVWRKDRYSPNIR
jgi:hypothetical protein